MPPTPKPASQRRRTNPVAGVATLDEGGRKGAIPSPVTELELCPTALSYWETVWRSPMGLVFVDADVFPLSRLVELVHERASGHGSAAADGEIRALEDRFGVSPLARRRLNWEIGLAAGAVDPAPAPAVPEGESARERMSRLRIA